MIHKHDREPGYIAFKVSDHIFKIMDTGLIKMKDAIVNHLVVYAEFIVGIDC